MCSVEALQWFIIADVSLSEIATIADLGDQGTQNILNEITTNEKNITPPNLIGIV